MSIELSKEARAQAIASIERYFNENMEQRIGNIAAGVMPRSNAAVRTLPSGDDGNNHRSNTVL